MGGTGFTPDPGRLYEVGRDGRPYTLEPELPGAAEARERRVRRWWVCAVLLNGISMGAAAAAVFLLPRSAAAWFGVLPLLSAPLLLVPPLIRRRGLGPPRRIHRRRPDGFPPPELP
ncbi:hypothetical protein J8J14_14505 [Roseomonas sp. SSH11]|uniref:Uncharacterized protein n=1 Tax=Pararoseomonas baculiformis TaxID=2820812 RepID=A0ABS4AG49_9PROT|nr:hypothetical protein [Pararoseomonas baculiformis]MBP0445985.1 hypothetical protein [Pararoseomonas baculiformis]